MPNPLNTVVQIDLGKYPMKLIFAVIVTILTILSAMGEKSHIYELNQLPRNRTELTSIKSFDLTSNGITITATVRIEYIYRVTLDQHFRFLFLHLRGDGYNISLNNSNLAGNPVVDNDMVLPFEIPVIGPVHASLTRSKSHLISRDFVIQPHEVSGEKTVLSSAGERAFGRRINLTNVCWTSEKFFFFSRAVWAFEDPFVKFVGFGSVSGRRGSRANLQDFMRQRGIKEFREGSSLVVDCPRVAPLDWEWIKNTAAPIAYLQSSREFDTILALRATGDLSFFEKVGNVVGASHELICVRDSEVHHLTASNESLAFFRKLMIGEASEVTPKVIVLKSNSTFFTVTNVGEVAKAVCPDCAVQEIVAEDIKPLQLVQIMAEARFVIAPYSSALSQAFWMQGTLIEIIPNGTQCQNWTFEVSEAARVKHWRFAVENSTEPAPVLEEACPTDVIKLYNRTVQVSVEAVLSRLQA
jgi:hypothetical protein